MIRLYDNWRSSASYRLRIALGLARLSWQRLPVNLVEAEQWEPEHLLRNPQGLAPVLEIDGKSFTRSLANIEYLDETHSHGLLPADPADRAHVHAAATRSASTFTPSEICAS